MLDKSNKNVILKIIGAAVVVFLVVLVASSFFGRDPLIGLNFMIWKSQEFLQAPNMID